ncbi:hypothetical protein O181_024573 [Austropuccinia psidii MF-1]|uniref:Uncharacterized protein n=1 Tax=Austropuccinia psidii MF-1 TaxID=1389203 RepID=A0A9Q3CL16_9BASI|nr:hypothetical protein [Austropuccinia psidii MF-1]
MTRSIIDPTERTHTSVCGKIAKVSYARKTRPPANAHTLTAQQPSEAADGESPTPRIQEFKTAALTTRPSCLGVAKFGSALIGYLFLAAKWPMAKCYRLKQSVQSWFGKP